MIKVNGKSYKVTESLGFQHSVGMYAKVIMVDGKERTVVKDSGGWRFWVPILIPAPTKAVLTGGSY